MCDGLDVAVRWKESRDSHVWAGQRRPPLEVTHVRNHRPQLTDEVLWAGHPPRSEDVSWDVDRSLGDVLAVGEEAEKVRLGKAKLESVVVHVVDFGV